jgi:hypothetical protein
MKMFSCVCAVAAMVSVSTNVALAQAQQGRAPAALAYVSVDRANFQKVEGAPQISSAPAWGDPEHPPFAEFVKFEPAYDS